MSRTFSIPLLLLPTLCLLGGCFAASAAPVATVSTVDRGVVEGELLGIDADGVDISTTSGDQSIDQASLLRIDFADEKSAPIRPRSSSVVRLANGSVLPIAKVEADATDARLELAPPIAAGPSQWKVPLADVRSIRFSVGGATLAESWSAIVSEPSPQDRVVLLRNEGQSLDTVGVVVESITAEFVAVTLGQQRVEVPREKIYGVVLATNVDEPNDAAAIVARLRGGEFAITAERIQMTDAEVVELGLSNGFELSLPIEKLATLDFSSSKLAYLSDLPPSVTQWRPLFGTPAAFASDEAVGPLRVDRGFWSEAFVVVNRADVFRPSQRFDHGLAIRSAARLTYELSSEYDRLRGVVGFPPDAGADQRLTFRVEVHEHTLYETHIAASEAPVEIDVPLDGADEITIVVERDGVLDGTLHFGDARLIK